MYLAIPALRSGALAAVLTATLTLTAPAPQAQAHPFGPPQTATVVATGSDMVQVRWKFGGTDDISYLAVSLDVLPADRVTLDGAVFYEEGDDILVAGSPVFHDYVLRHILVSNQGRPCTGVVEPLSDLTEDGAMVDYRCPTPLDKAAVTIDMLNDLHPAYRTLATGPDGQRAVYDGGSMFHDWTFDTSGMTAAGAPTADSAAMTAGATVSQARAAASEGDSSDAQAASTNLGQGAAVQLAAVGAGLAAVLAGTFLWLRARKRRA